MFTRNLVELHFVNSIMAVPLNNLSNISVTFIRQYTFLSSVFYFSAFNNRIKEIGHCQWIVIIE